MSDARFQVVFAGQALSNGEMDVHTLAPALLSLGDLFKSANRVLNGELAPAVSVNINAEFRAGSFGIDIHILQSVFDHAKTLLMGQEGVDAKQLAEAILFWVGIPSSASVGLFKVFKLLKGRKPDKITYQDNSTHIHVGGDVIVAPEAVGRLLQNSDVLAAAKGTMEPLHRDGIESVEFREDGQVEVMTREDAENVCALVGGEGDGEAITNEHIVLLTIIKPSFDENQNWRFSDGTTSFNATVTDTRFVERVKDRAEGFYYGDIFKVRLSVTQRVVGNKLRVSRIVTEILEHRGAAEQRNLPLAPKQGTLPPANGK